MVTAINRGSQKSIEDTLATIQTTNSDAHTKRIAQRIVRSGTPRTNLQAPSKIDASKSIPLTDTKPSSAKVGWGRPAYDRVPGPALLMESGGTLYAHGIYAHAPAQHAYDLNLQGTRELELLTEDDGDGTSSDWGFWLDPTLSR